MKKVIISIFILTLSFHWANAQTSLPNQYLDVGKKILNHVKESIKDNIIIKPADAYKYDGSISSLNSEIYNSELNQNIIKFAETLIGKPYRYATSNPNIGFDCSGFVNYVFKNFGFHMPRSSKEFSIIGEETSLKNAKSGDIIIFKGTNPKINRIGHVGIVYANDENGMSFIHASSGKAKRVIITELNQHYKNRFVKIVRVI